MDRPEPASPWLQRVALLLGVLITAVLIYLGGIFYSAWNEGHQAEQTRAETKAIEASKTVNAPVVPGAAGQKKASPAGEHYPLSLSPLYGSGASGRFTAKFTRPAGAAEHYLAYLLFLPTPGGVSYTAKGSCELEYNRISNGMRLINDAGDNWLGPQSGVRLSDGGRLSNAVCALDIGRSSAQLTGNTLTVTYAVTFAPNFTGTLATFLQELDTAGHWAGVTQLGNWTAFPASAPKPGPAAEPAIPDYGTGSSGTFATTFSHSGGLGKISFATMLIASAVTGSPACQLFYFEESNKMNLINDAGTAFVSPAGVPPGSKLSLSNSRCSLTAGTVTRNGSSATLAFTVTFVTGTFGGFKNVYVQAFDTDGLTTHWVGGAGWTVE